MTIRTLFILTLCFFINGCKTFILYQDDISHFLPQWNTDLVTHKMCIDNKKIKNSYQNRCVLMEDAVDVELIDGGFVFAVDKYFLRDGFDDRRVRKSLDKNFKTDFKIRYNSAEDELLSKGLNWLFDGAIEANQQERIYKAKQKEKKRKKDLIDRSLNSFFGVAYSRLNDAPTNSGIGLKVRMFTYEESNSTYALAEVSFVDMKNNNREMGNKVFGYVDRFDVGRGGFNVHIPSCFVQTQKLIDGCELSSYQSVTNMIRRSQLSSGDGTPLISMSFAKYVPPPKEPRALGIPLDI